MEKKEIYTTWKSSFEGVSETQIKKAFDAIVKQYEQPHRYYHNLEHVAYILRQIDQLKLIKRDRQILIYTAFYHDVIYKAGSTQNEIESADFAKQWLQKLKLDASIIQSVERSILATQNHQSNNELTQLFLDMDMSILASDQQAYESYTEAIVKENRRFPSFLFRMKRKQFIKNTLKKSEIFLTELYRNRYELIARTNLLRELNTL